MGFLRLGSGGGLLIALIFNIVALSTPTWIAYTERTSCGLFNCVLRNGGLSPIEKGVAEKVAIAFNILAMVTIIGAAALVLLAGKDEEKDNLGRIGGILAIVSALFMLIEMAAYTGMKKELLGASVDIPWGYSYALGWTAFCLAFIGGIVALAGK